MAKRRRTSRCGLGGASKLDNFTAAYLEAALRSSVNEYAYGSADIYVGDDGLSVTR